MQSKMKHLVAELLPHKLRRILTRRKHRTAEEPEWEYLNDQWPQSNEREFPGWNHQSIIAAYESRWASFRQKLQTADPLAFTPESPSIEQLDPFAHNVMMTFGYCLALAAHGKTILRMLDWGGGIGHYYLISRALIPDLEIEYHCKDLPLAVEAGRKLLPEAHFYSDDSYKELSYDFVFAISSLQYVRDWKDLLKMLAERTMKYVLITSLPIVNSVDSFVFIQRPRSYGYSTQYPAWCLNRNQLLREATNSGLTLAREFFLGYQPKIQNAAEQNQYRGYLFSRRTS